MHAHASLWDDARTCDSRIVLRFFVSGTTVQCIKNARSGSFYEKYAKLTAALFRACLLQLFVMAFSVLSTWVSVQRILFHAGKII